MKATIKFATERFREFNRQMFEGRLPEVPILMSDAGRALGMLKYERKRDLSGNVTCGNFRILISTRYDLPQEQIEDTIIHEMIHLYIAYNNLKDTSTHGDRFKYHMNIINHKYNRNVTVSNRDMSINDTDQSRRPHYVCETHWSDGSWFITCCARTRIFDINRECRIQSNCMAIRWWFTPDPFFNRFPNCKKLKLYRINHDDYAAHITTAIECECSENRFQPKKHNK